MTTYGYPITIRQSYQPNQQGAETGAALYFSKIGDKRIGNPKRSSIWDDVAGKFDYTDMQRVETTFQITALVKQTATTVQTQKTASDYLNMASVIMNGMEFIRALQNAGVGILRVTNIRNPYFKNDKDQFEASPSFDFTVIYNRELARFAEPIQTIEFNYNMV